MKKFYYTMILVLIMFFMISCSEDKATKVEEGVYRVVIYQKSINKVRVKWSDNYASNFDEYILERRVNGEEWETIALLDDDDYEYFDEGLIPGATYEYGVQIRDNDFYTKRKTRLKKLALPSKPSNFRCEKFGMYEIMLLWDVEGIGFGYNYLIEMKKENGQWENLGFVNYSPRRHVVTVDEYNTNYKFRLRVYHEYYDPILDEYFTYNTDYVETSTFLDDVILEPEEFSASQQINSIELEWKNVGASIQTVIQKSLDSNNWTTLYTSSPDNILTELVDDDVEYFTTYYYRTFYTFNSNISDCINREIILDEDKGILNTMVHVPGGTFIMGDAFSKNSSNTHYESIESFQISRYEISIYEYYQIMETNFKETNRGHFEAKNNLSPTSMIKYCNKRSIKENLTPCYSKSGNTDMTNWNYSDAPIECDYSANGYRLPTEAEWEYAARGARNIPNFRYAGSDNYEEVARCGYDGDVDTFTRTKAPNSLGIYDMCGNVSDVCLNGSLDTSFCIFGEARIRGGSYRDRGELCAIHLSRPCTLEIDLGFRIVRRA